MGIGVLVCCGRCLPDRRENLHANFDLFFIINVPFFCDG